MDTIKRVFKNKEVMKKILFTLIAFLIFKLATRITIPLVNKDVLASLFSGTDSGFLGIVNAFTGDALMNYSIIALGISPYITASIIVQLLQMDIIRPLKEWSEEGETGKQKLNQLTRYVAIGLAFAQSIAMSFAFTDAIFIVGIDEGNFLIFTFIALVMTAGTAFAMWLADQITLHGVGNGSSMLIAAGILISFPNSIISLVEDYIVSGTYAWKGYLIVGAVLLVFIIILVAITFMEQAVRKITIQYSNRPAAAKFQGRTDSNFPIKLNTASVIPVIFASTLLSIPNTILQYIPSVSNTSFGLWLSELLTYNRPLGFVVYIILIFVFSIFYTFLQIKPDKTAEDLQKQNAYIPGVRPGAETEAYLTKTLYKVTIVGALYLIVIATLPILATAIFGLPSYIQIGGTSLLIVVGVAIETTRQIETDVQDKDYSGFIK